MVVVGGTVVVAGAMVLVAPATGASVVVVGGTAIDWKLLPSTSTTLPWPLRALSGTRAASGT